MHTQSTTRTYLCASISKAGVRRSTKLANFLGRGLVSKDNWLIKSLNHDTRVTCHVTIVRSKNGFYVALIFYCETTQKADRTMGPPLVTRHVSHLLVVHFISRLSLETKPRLKSWPTLSIV